MPNYGKGRAGYAGWSEEEVERLRAMYPTTRWVDLLPLFPARTRQAISQMARNVLKLPRPIAPRPKWTDAEDAIVRDKYQTAPDDELRASLPRHSWVGIQRRASDLKVIRPRREAREHTRVVYSVFKQLYQDRLRQHMKRSELSRLMGYCHGMLLNWELGKSQPSFREVVDWAQALGLELVLAIKETRGGDNVVRLPTKAQLMAGRAYSSGAVVAKDRIKALEAEVADLRRRGRQG